MRIKTALLTGAGLMLLAIGAVGVFLPVLPTTPFVLASAGCLTCNPKLRARVLKIPFFNEYIDNYIHRRGLARKTVVRSFVFLWGMLVLSAFLARSVWVTLVLAGVGIGVTVHILWIARARGARGGGLMGRRRVFGYFELIFDAVYLSSVLVAGVYLLTRDAGGAARLAGAMALVLAGGDAFHLVPRMIAVCTGGEQRLARALGLGKLTASVTMTVFYVLLWQLGLLLAKPAGAGGWTAAVYALAAVRIALCLFPQNRWTEARQPARWSVYRNLPFFLLGALVAGFFFVHRGAVAALSPMWLAIVLSFAFYLPVALWVNRRPALGMLMFPKTCAYIWMVAMCLGL